MYIHRKTVCRLRDELTSFDSVAYFYDRLCGRADMLREIFFYFAETFDEFVVKRRVYLIFFDAEPCHQPFERDFSVLSRGVDGVDFYVFRGFYARRAKSAAS